MEAEKKTLRVAAQLTISPRIISLVAEENHIPFKKGQIVKRICRRTLDTMERPLNVVVSNGGGVRIITK
jgi:hypothetical protein